METKDRIPENKNFLNSDLYKFPEKEFWESFNELEFIIDEEVFKSIEAYFHQIITEENPRDDTWQEEFEGILKEVLYEIKYDKDAKEFAGLIFNLHRIFTEFRGYAANDKASSDVDAAFKDLEVTDEGVILVDFFVTRNLPAIIKRCEEKNIDLSRIRIAVPKIILAAQLMKMNEEKRQEFETACAKLTEDQFLTTKGDSKIAMHNADIKNEDQIALWFAPRTMAITPKLQAETEEETITNFVNYFKGKIKKVVDGGEIFANLAFSDEFKPLQLEKTNGNRKLTKLTGISRDVAVAIVEMLQEEGFEYIPKKGAEDSSFNPSEVNPEIDHTKMAKWMHFRKTA